MRKNYTKLLIIFFAVIIFFGSITYKMYLLNNQYVNVFNQDSFNLVIGEKIIKANNPVKVPDGVILISFDIMKKYIDPNIYWDQKLKKVTVTTNDKLIRMKTGSLTALVNNKPMNLKFPVTSEGNAIFIPIEFLKDLYNIDVSFIKSTNVVIIDFKSQKKLSAVLLKKEVLLKQAASIWSPAVTKISMGIDEENPEIFVFEDNGKWCKVRTSDGTIGYVAKKHLKIKNIEQPNKALENAKESQWKPQKGKINMVWEAIYNNSPNVNTIGKIEGLDVISPTWFQLSDENGNLINKVNTGYLKWAKGMGYKIWALVSNDFDNPKMTGNFLSNSDARDNMMRELLSYAAVYGLDGINIDFENINKQDKNALTQFIRELTPLLKEQGLVVSIDVGVPDGSDNWSKCFDRKALSGIVDYVILMAYDQYWASSPVAGSVAQLSWVEKNVNKTLLEVPSEKLILGIPFYSRLWEEKSDQNGKIKVKSTSKKMSEVKDLLKKNQAIAKWDEVGGQFYSEYAKNGSVYKIWIEDVNSTNMKSSLVQKYNLAGCSSWNRSFVSKEVWGVLNQNLKILNNYQEWLVKNTSNKFVYNQENTLQK